MLSPPHSQFTERVALGHENECRHLPQFPAERRARHVYDLRTVALVSETVCFTDT
jgi:hypothetical protein